MTNLFFLLWILPMGGVLLLFWLCLKLFEYRNERAFWAKEKIKLAEERKQKMIEPSMIEMALYFLPTEQGGRETPISGIYRTMFHLDNDINWTIDLDVSAKPGELWIVSGRFLCQEPYQLVKKGMCFELREGAKTMALGIIIGK